MKKSQTQMSTTVQIGAEGIRNALSKYKIPRALAELVWNGFDATANCVEINYTFNSTGFLESLTVGDNGLGIPYDQLDEKFKPFLQSEKKIATEETRNLSAKHGKNGFGRLMFYKIANSVKWQTVFEHGPKLLEYDIQIDSKAIEMYSSTEPVVSTENKTGTLVELKDFLHISDKEFEDDVLPYLKLEFCWYLELNEAHGYNILVNGSPLDYSDMIGERENDVFLDPNTSTRFEYKYIRWNNNLNKEYSKYYYLNSHNKEQWKEFTRLNKKGDHFYHSVFIKSEFFDNFNWHSSPTAKQQGLNGIGIFSGHQFQFLQSELYSLLRSKRSPFLKIYANRLVNEYEEEQIFPVPKNEWEKTKISGLQDTVKGLYEVQPKIFVNMNIEQKKTFVRLLDLLLDSDERERLMDIIGEVVDLEPEEREHLSSLFKATSLSRITLTIRLLAERYRAVSNLKQLVFNKELKANEVKHVQGFVESHYWLFGEEYQLVTAAEPDFEEALRRYLYILRGHTKKVKIDHPDKNKEMDIFMCKQSYSRTVENIVVELKHPDKPLGKDQLDQVVTYMRTILNTPEFNDRNSDWTFFLVGNKLHKTRDESKPYIQSQIAQLKHLGQPFLAAFEEEMRYKVYVKTWSQVFNEFEQKHNFLNNKLKLQRENLIIKHNTADAALEDSKGNYAAQLGEVSIPNKT